MVAVYTNKNTHQRRTACIMNLTTYENGVQVAVSPDGEICVLDGEKFGWKRNKKGGAKLARLYRKSGYMKHAQRVRNCATWLQFYAMENGEKQLMSANFCHLRLCPMCTARRAGRAAYKLSKVLDKVEAEHPGVKFLFLTLTIRNVDGPSLGDAISHLTHAWSKLTRNRQVERSVRGWFRAIEITRSGKSYHPHLHAILAVDPEYFSRKSGLYISHDEWVNRWQKALQVDYRPSVRIQTAKAKGEYSAGRAAAVEAAKYAIKEDDYIDPELPEDEAVQIVRDYTDALHRRRLTAFGGWLKSAAKELDALNLDDGDLVHIEDETIRPDLADYIELYNWHFGIGDYILAKREVNPLKIKRE